MIEHAQERVHLDDVSDVHEDVMIEHAHEQVRLDDVRDVHDKVRCDRGHEGPGSSSS